MRNLFPLPSLPYRLTRFTVLFSAGIYPYETHGLLWRPYKLMQVMQTEDESSGMRAAIFFLSLVFIVSQFCVNVRPPDFTYHKSFLRG